MTDYLFEQLSYAAIGTAMEVHRLLGPGFLEGVYEQALAVELGLREIPFRRQVPLTVLYKNVSVGDYRPDFVVDDRIIIEVKAVSDLASAHESQAHHYLVATGMRLAILLNFGARSLQIRRIIR